MYANTVRTPTLAGSFAVIYATAWAITHCANRAAWEMDREACRVWVQLLICVMVGQWVRAVQEVAR